MKMSFLSVAPLHQENLVALGKAAVPGPARPGPRLVLGVLTENEERNRALAQVSSKHEPLVPGSVACAVGDHVLEPVTDSFLLPSELLVLDDAVQDVGSGCCLDASMRSLPEEDEASASFENLCVQEYAEDIHKHLRATEVNYRPRPSYMRKQPDMTNCMRVVLVDWMVEVGEEYKLCSDTLYLAVNYLDRFLSCMSVLRGKLQLVGTAAVLLAAKYEEVYPPEVDEFVYITDDTYTKKQLLRMEQHLLRVLSFDLTAPTALQFLMQYTVEQHVCARTVSLALYLSELSLLDVDPFLQFLPSKIAAAAFSLANYTLNQALWPDALYAFTGYSLVVISPCLKALHKLHLGASSRTQKAVYEKYKSSKYCGASLLEPVQDLPLL